jgi:antitoxin ParD1/3/4
LAYYANDEGNIMPTRNVVLTDHQAELIEKLVESGRYQNASEVLREGLRLVESREVEDRVRLEALRQAVQVGIDDLEAGRYREFNSFADLDGYLSKVTDEVLAKRRSGRKRK